MECICSKRLTDLIGLSASITRNVTIVDAREYETGVTVRVSDEMGDEYWTGLEDLDINR